MPPDSLSARARQGLVLFHARHYFHAHEVLEEVWRDAAPHDRKFFQGLIQISVALYHHSRGNLVGCKSLLARAARNLSNYPSRHFGIDLPPLLRSIAEWQHALERQEPAPPPPRIMLHETISADE